jgi:predicted nucleic acid-binding protein
VADVLVDASALVALLDADDGQHDRAVEALKGLRDPLATVWPALTEAMHLVADTRRGVETLCDMVSDGAVTLLPIEPSEFPRMKALMQQYRDLPMDFADAALVRVAERERLTRILTFDKHFSVYRLPRRTRFTVLPSSR